MSRLSTRSLLRIAAVAALAAALGLAGCGRKGGLDPPPGGTVVSSGGTVSDAPVGAEAPPPEFGPDGKPLPPLPSGVTRRRTFIDFLID